MAAPILAPLGLLGFVFYASARSGHWDEWRRAQGHWHQSFDFSRTLPALPLFLALGSKLRSRPAAILAAAEVVTLPVLLHLYLTAPHFVP
jgi:hypothetical protein